MIRKRILFVCHGNICRSPMGEFILKAMAEAEGIGGELHIESAAVSAEEIGNGIYPPAKACLQRHGIPFSNAKKARRICREDYERFNLILCMDASNMRLIKHIIPGDPQHKIQMLSSYAGMGRDIADPWYTNDFETTFTDISLACKALVKQL